MALRRIDLFICHASEDKGALARPLAEELRARNWSVWYDEFELALGDDLRQTIDRGLAEARFGLVVLSPRFFGKKWPQRELDGLTARETTGSSKVILPVWHEVDEAYVAHYSPTLAGKVAVKSTAGIPAIVAQIESVLARPPSVLRPAEEAPADERTDERSLPKPHNTSASDPRTVRNLQEKPGRAFPERPSRRQKMPREWIMRHILDAATNRLLRYGFHNTTMKDIAGDADVSTASIYTYFPTKQDLYERVSKRVLAPDERYLGRGFDDSKSPLQELTDAGQEYLSFGIEYPGFFQVIAEPSVFGAPSSDLTKWAICFRPPWFVGCRGDGVSSGEC